MESSGDLGFFFCALRGGLHAKDTLSDPGSSMAICSCYFLTWDTRKVLLEVFSQCFAIGLSTRVGQASCLLDCDVGDASDLHGPQAG